VARSKRDVQSVASLSWIPTRLIWSEDVGTFCCLAEAHDVDLVEIIAAGLVSVSFDSRRIAKPMSILLEAADRSATGACLAASASFLSLPARTPLTFYFHDIFRVPDSRLLVVLGRDRPETTARRRERRRAAIRLAWEYRHKRRASHSFIGYPVPSPQARFSELQIELETVTFAPHLGKSDSSAERSALNAVVQSGRAVSRTGAYHCNKVRNHDGSWGAIIRWVPRGQLVPALEIKAAAEATFLSAFAEPRIGTVARPEPGAIDEGTVRGGIDIDDAEDLTQETLSDDLPQGGEEGKDLLRSNGFEAIAWYQAFHKYTDAVWGIYFDAPRLDLVVASLARDLRLVSPRPFELAARLLVQLVTIHELFHARVEFSATWLEIAARRKRYLPYSKNVYETCRFTERWLEEALANWCSHRWYVEAAPTWKFKGLIKDATGVERIIVDWLDLSPPGYSHWRVGEQHGAWRRLANEVRSGRPSEHSRKRNLPYEGLLHSQIIDLQPDDVPVYFVGRGVVADAYYSTPSRREVIRVLRLLGYNLLPGRGKGGHELWQGPDGRSFPVPTRDPLSLTVFVSLLHHFGWTKKQYLHDIRPKI
jgi:hypothetical protein